MILDEKSVDFGNSECSVRLNSVESGLCEEDIKVILGGPNLPDAVHLPKVDHPDEMAWFTNKVSEAVSAHPHEDISMGFILFTESARSLLCLKKICEEAVYYHSMSGILVPEAIVFGSDDFVADIGATRTVDASELAYARQKVVVTAKAFGLQAIDLVHVGYKDLECLERQSLEGARMGFTGKQVIHPAQIPVVQKAFSPTLEKIEWATQLIKEFREHEKNGKGAFNFRDHMIDMPLVKQAQNIVDMNERLHLV